MTDGRRQLLLGVAALSGVATLLALAVAPDRPQLVWISRPVATAALLALAALTTNAQSAVYRRLVSGGLLASLVGDVLLMIPGDHFLAGLTAFLVAHLLYLAAFGTQGPLLRSRAAVGAYAVVGTSVLSLILPAVGGLLRAAMVAYVLVLCAMAAQGMSWLVEKPASRTALLAALGAALLTASDTLLALDRFVAFVPARDALVLGAYWVAQACLAWSVQRPPPPTMRM